MKEPRRINGLSREETMSQSRNSGEKRGARAMTRVMTGSRKKRSRMSNAEMKQTGDEM